MGCVCCVYTLYLYVDVLLWGVPHKTNRQLQPYICYHHHDVSVYIFYFKQYVDIIESIVKQETTHMKNRCRGGAVCQPELRTFLKVIYHFGGVVTSFSRYELNTKNQSPWTLSWECGFEKTNGTLKKKTWKHHSRSVTLASCAAWAHHYYALSSVFFSGSHVLSGRSSWQVSSSPGIPPSQAKKQYISLQ